MVALEAHLEAWAEADPSLIASGYTVVGRQVRFHGGPADLIAIDAAGRWVVVEIKRASNQRDDITQALDYASSLRMEISQDLRNKLAENLRGKAHREEALALIDTVMRDETLPREVVLHLMGVGAAPGVERIAQMLRDSGQEVRFTTLTAHQDLAGRMILSRPPDEVAEVEESPSSTAASLDDIRHQAEEQGVLEFFDRLVALATAAGLQVRPYTRSVMITPPRLANTFLLVASPVRGGIRMNHATIEWARHFPWIAPEVAARYMGETARGMGTTVSTADLPARLEAIEHFLTSHFPAPEGFEALTEEGAPWTRETFLLKLAADEKAQAAAGRLMDSVGANGRVEFGRSAVGQAYLRYLAEAPAVLQLRGVGALRGLWSMTRSHPSDHPGWKPLKDALAPFGGLGETGGAPAIPLAQLSEAVLDAIAVAAVESSRALLESMGRNRPN